MVRRELGSRWPHEMTRVSGLGTTVPATPPARPAWVTLVSQGEAQPQSSTRRHRDPIVTSRLRPACRIAANAGIVMEAHQSELLCSGSARGAVFTVVLPPFPAEVRCRAPRGYGVDA
jgi:hypothetical protein